MAFGYTSYIIDKPGGLYIMETINAHGILNVDTISRGNNKPWEKLLAYMAEHNINEPTNFDFNGIEIVQPYNSDSFLKLLGNPNFYMTIHNNPKVAASINVMMALVGGNSDRIRAVQAEIPKKETPEQRNLANMAKQLQEYFETNNGVGELHIYKRFDQIGVPKTVNYIREAMKLYHENTKVSHIVLYTSNISIQPCVTQEVANLVKDMAEVGITLEIVTDDPDLRVKLGIYHSIGANNYTLAQKFDIMKARLTKGRVGILTKYKEGRSTDEFGRMGRGEKAQVRVAIFQGFQKTDTTVMAVFRSFNGNTFYPASHWQLEHDGEIMEDIKGDLVYIPISDLGIYNDFVGPRYHFSTPVQYSDEGSEYIYGADHEGKVHGRLMTIPERAKEVFEDHLIPYEHESLDAYIEETRRILGK